MGNEIESTTQDMDQTTAQLEPKPETPASKPQRTPMFQPNRQVPVADEIAPATPSTQTEETPPQKSVEEAAETPPVESDQPTQETEVKSVDSTPDKALQKLQREHADDRRAFEQYRQEQDARLVSIQASVNQAVADLKTVVQQAVADRQQNPPTPQQAQQTQTSVQQAGDRVKELMAEIRHELGEEPEGLIEASKFEAIMAKVVQKLAQPGSPPLDVDEVIGKVRQAINSDMEVMRQELHQATAATKPLEIAQQEQAFITQFPKAFPDIPSASAQAAARRYLEVYNEELEPTNNLTLNDEQARPFRDRANQRAREIVVAEFMPKTPAKPHMIDKPVSKPDKSAAGATIMQQAGQRAGGGSPSGKSTRTPMYRRPATTG